jgi:hypothetical protein
MNKIIKYIIIVLNVLVLIVAINWYFRDKEFEPLIAVIGQFIALLVLFFEDKLSKVINIKNVNTDIETNILGKNNVDVLNKKNKDSNIRTTIR